MLVPATMVPIDDPKFAAITINSAFKNLLDKIPLIEKISFGTLFTSSTVGFLIEASTKPANHPQAKNGFNEVNGAAIKAVNMLKGCPNEIAVNKAAKTEL